MFRAGQKPEALTGKGKGGNSARKGDRLGEWLLESRIGAGTFGEVWKARHHVWGDDHVAVKIPTDPQYLRALRREGITAHHLDHPAIVRPIGFDPFAQRPYLVMEFVDGDDLRTYLQKHGKLSVAETVDILGRVLQGLGYAHEKGVLHRDVKPENVLLHHTWAFDPAAADEPGLVKLTDFGLGKAESSLLKNKAGGSIVFSNDENTASQAITGSLDYMAPEQRAGGAVDHRADLYACGVMLFELLTGERPAGTDLPSDLVQGVPAHIDEAFRRSYARVDRRFSSAAEFLDALRLPGRLQPS
ncbi:MAG: serine/threonine-protein kinase, partial [Planctomycetota bacterium]